MNQFKEILIKTFTIILPSLLFFANISFSKNQELILPETVHDSKWEENMQIPDDIEIFQTISESHSKTLLNSARNFFNDALEIYRKSTNEINEKKLDYQKDHPEDRFEWQKKAREDAQNKELARLLNSARQKSIIPLIHAMESIEHISNPEVLKSKEFKGLKSSIYREYIKHQYALKNYNQALDLLEKYINIDEEYNSDKKAHKLLAVCYNKLLIYEKNKNEKLSRLFHEKKNFHILKYTELLYGKSSQEYRNAVIKIEKDY